MEITPLVVPSINTLAKGKGLPFEITLPLIIPSCPNRLIEKINKKNKVILRNTKLNF